MNSLPTMQKLDANDPATRSADLIAANIEYLRSLFPEAWAEGKIDFDVLRQLLGGAIDDREEKYGLNWHGKRRARQIALTPSAGTLRPCQDDSVEWDSTQNVMIEGDNLEVLKLLQKSYAGRVKMIYIDPPYNTGSDFVYPDNFHHGVENYLELTGQTKGGSKLSSNTEASGRFHTDWLNMMYPRLKLARNLLSEDGAIFVSIDDHEVSNLRAMLSEIFGEENFVAVFVWKRRTGAMDSVNNVSTDHEYVVCYSRSKISLNGELRTFEKYQNPDGDVRGPWIADNLSAAKPGGDTYYAILDPDTGKEYLPPVGRYWPYSRGTMQVKIAEGRVLFPKGKSGTPMLKRFEREAKSLTQPASTWIVPQSQKVLPAGTTTLQSGLTSDGTRTIKELFDDKVFTYAKPLSLIRSLLRQGTSKDAQDIVLDFFAGSATTGHAVLEQNAEDGGNRRVILVQLPEPVSPDVEGQESAARACDKLGKPRNIAELAKERMRRAGKKIRETGQLAAGDTGFRVFGLASSNFVPWDPSTGDLSALLTNSTAHILADRSNGDLYTELLLKLGLDLCVVSTVREVSGKRVACVGEGVLFVCLDTALERSCIEPLGNGIAEWSSALGTTAITTCVFRDDGFHDDVGKANIVAILQQRGIANIRSL